MSKPLTHQELEEGRALHLDFDKLAKVAETGVPVLPAVVQDARTRLEQAALPVHVSPLAGLEWFLALTLWFFNATCWSAWFGHGGPRVSREPDTVVGWLVGVKRREPQHCAALFAAYAEWCRAHGRTPLAQYSFYARLVELGARKFRDGRNGPTKYALPDHVV